MIASHEASFLETATALNRGSLYAVAMTGGGEPSRIPAPMPASSSIQPFCYAEAAASLLTNPALDPFGKIPEFEFCAVRAEKAEIRSAAERARSAGVKSSGAKERSRSLAR